LKNFIKYNNGEHWEDNWDKKDDNKGYTKIDFPNISGPAAPAAQPAAPAAQPATPANPS
jgi:hypothetical protein